MLNNLLYIAWQPDEYLVRFGSMGIRWYGMCWLVGLVLGYFLMQWLYRRHKFPDEKFDPLFLYVFFGVLAGARLGHCLFYEPQDFLTSWDGFLSIFIPFHHLADGSWKYVGYQGLASHGGVSPGTESSGDENCGGDPAERAAAPGSEAPSAMISSDSTTSLEGALLRGLRLGSSSASDWATALVASAVDSTSACSESEALRRVRAAGRRTRAERTAFPPFSPCPS